MAKNEDGKDQKGQNQNNNQSGENNNDGNGSPDISGELKTVKAELETLKKSHADSQQYIQDTSVVLSAIGSDESVKKAVQDSIVKMYGPTSSTNPPASTTAIQ